MSKPYSIVKIENLPHSEVSIEAEISADELTAAWPKAVTHLSKHAKLDGFRPGHIPESVLVSKLGEMAILEEAAEILLAEYYPKIALENKIRAIGRPQVTITKLAKGNPVSFKLITAVVPEFKLPNYKKIAAEIMTANDESTEVTEKEYEDFVLQIRKGRAPHVHKEGEEHHDDEEVVLPELNDDFVKSLGQFENVEDFKTKIQTSMKQEKEYKTREKKRLETLEKLIEQTEIDLPKVLLASELAKMQSQFEDSLKSMNISLEDYYKRINKSIEELQKEWEPDATKRAKSQLILDQIAVDEKIEPAKEDIEKETTHLLQHHKDADPQRVALYVESMLTNEKVLQFLENQK